MFLLGLVCFNGNFIQIHSRWGRDVLGHPLGMSAPGMSLGLLTKANFSFVDMFGTPSGRPESMENLRFTVGNSFPMEKSLPSCLSSCLGPQIPFAWPRGWKVLPRSCPGRASVPQPWGPSQSPELRLSGDFTLPRHWSSEMQHLLTFQPLWHVGVVLDD